MGGSFRCSWGLGWISGAALITGDDTAEPGCPVAPECAWPAVSGGVALDNAGDSGARVGSFTLFPDIGAGEGDPCAVPDDARTTGDADSRTMLAGTGWIFSSGTDRRLDHCSRAMLSKGDLVDEYRRGEPADGESRVERMGDADEGAAGGRNALDAMGLA